jgi:hypothetical protein
MSLRKHLGGMLAAGIVGAFGLPAAIAQSAPAQSGAPSSAPCTVSPQPAPCTAAPVPGSKPSTADKFPFPEDTGGETAQPATANAPAAAASGAPEDSGGAAKRPSGADLPFPDEDPKKPSPALNNLPFPEEEEKPAPGVSGSSSGTGSNSGSGSSSSSSSSNSNNDFPADADSQPGAPADSAAKDQPTQGRRLLHRVNPIGTKLQTPEEREAEDLDVAHFYTQTGDLKGAYLRSQDAVKTAPDDPDAHFALAGIALKLNKHDEAVAEYQACLKLDPDDKQAKAARKELARLKQR